MKSPTVSAAISSGGIGAIHVLARQLGLIDAIDRRLHLLKFHFPYHESDHVLNFAYNALCDGTCLQDLELRRNDEVFLDALGARRIPDPTTAGDFCRRFDETSIRLLQDIFHDMRIGVWAEQPAEFFDQAIIDMDGTLVETTGQCKQGMDIAYDGTWGYHPLVLSLANTGRSLSLVNRSGNRPSHEGAAAEVDRAIGRLLPRRLPPGAAARRHRLLADRAPGSLERDPRVQFIFGYDAAPNLNALADESCPKAWQTLQRPPRYEVKTQPRQRPENVKEAIVVRAGVREHQAASRSRWPSSTIGRRPAARRIAWWWCARTCRWRKGERLLFDDIVYFFYITNDWVARGGRDRLLANDRCNQENLLAQLKAGCVRCRRRWTTW